MRIKLLDTLLSMRFLRYCIAGGVSGLCYLAIIGLLNSTTTLPISISNGIAYLVGIPVSFLIQKFWVFRSKERATIEVGPFIIIHIINLFVTSAIITLIVDVLKFHYLFGSIVVIAFVPLSTYIALKYIVFRKGITKHNHT